MPDSEALQAAKTELAYWQQQRDLAERTNDPARLVQCERFVTECAQMIAALTEAANGR
jgi:hypothetical protein